jgi:hypothetical protein
MKTLLIILICLEVIVALIAFPPIFIDRKSAVHALVEWKNNPTPENEAVWLREKAEMDRERRTANYCIFSLLGLNALGIIALILRIKNARTAQN